MRDYTKEDLEALPTLAVEQTDDLKIDENGYRIWLARTTVEDGEPYNDRITIEQFNPVSSAWDEIESYLGDSEDPAWSEIDYYQ